MHGAVSSRALADPRRADVDGGAAGSRSGLLLAGLARAGPSRARVFVLVAVRIRGRRDIGCRLTDCSCKASSFRRYWSGSSRSLRGPYCRRRRRAMIAFSRAASAWLLASGVGVFGLGLLRALPEIVPLRQERAQLLLSFFQGVGDRVWRTCRRRPKNIERDSRTREPVRPLLRPQSLARAHAPPVAPSSSTPDIAGVITAPFIAPSG